jgi:hypothetical protein
LLARLIPMKGPKGIIFPWTTKPFQDNNKQLSEHNLANAIAVQNNQMLHEHLTEAAASVQFLVKDLQAVNNHADQKGNR